jgi:hypothetical protein
LDDLVSVNDDYQCKFDLFIRLPRHSSIEAIDRARREYNLPLLNSDPVSLGIYSDLIE